MDEDSIIPTPTPAPAPSSAASDLLSKLDPRNIKVQMTKRQAIFALAATLFGLVLFVFFIYHAFVMFEKNFVQYPVLLSSPIRGAHFTHLPSTMEQTLFPVVDRLKTNHKGVVLPYRGNELSFIHDAYELPDLNNQVQFTLAFWVKIENLSQLNQSCASTFAKLFVQGRYRDASNQDSGLGSFAVMYDVTNNDLVISVDHQKRTGSNAHSTVQSQVFHVPNTMLIQKWQMVTIVLDNRDLDIYHNNALVRSFHLDNVPYLVNNHWRLFPGKTPFVGTVSCVRYFDYAFNSHEVYRLHYWQRGQDVPHESYYWWWTWSRGNTLTALYRTIQKDIGRGE